MARVPLVVLLFAFAATTRVNATIFIPEEIPSLLSVVYSNLPPIKKGTDSRLGVGFRLGPNADVQFQLELGPQINTAPIGAQAAAGTGAVGKKRHVPSSQGSGAKPKDWLNAWRLQMSPGYVPDDRDDEHEAPASVHDDGDERMDAVAHLRQLYSSSGRTSTVATAA